MERIELFQNKSDCCGCGACMNICPKGAITMQEDEFGYVYPVIDDEKCVKCGLCKKACQYKDGTEFYKVRKAYAAAIKNSKEVMVVASGGIFTTLAKQVLSENGVVFGVSMDNIEGQLTPRHIDIQDEKDLYKLQGSKYVQSNTGNAYKKVKEYLLEGRNVLFSGTPCQITGLKAYLGKEYQNLLTVDVICHGVPSTRMFQDYIKSLEKKLGGKIYSYKFRDKSRGQGMNAQILYKKQNGEEKVKYIDGYLTSYFYMFLKSIIYRENCYSCPYARAERVSDITAGDFWGVYQVHADEMNKSNMSNLKGVSCMLLNTEKGLQYFEKIQNRLDYFESSVEKVAKNNKQLREPSERVSERENVLRIYQGQGYDGVEQYFPKIIGNKKYFYILKNLAPKGLKRRIKQVISMIKK
ncbi:MAG: Coenzyme F420 hydrogenase/dehydrogenase, beta subunit C-terminal domain [Lachnospiraceae bacterium]|nr:Coenzyme F420 hydrogenase/dehydrogenase, beta subunit C-terminal domain [Lachnospiraceae bacterium]